MRVLLDEQLPLDLAAALQGHRVFTVAGRGWTGITNGELLRRMGGEYDALVTMDRGIEFQQNLTSVAVGVLLVRASSNRMCTFSRSCQQSSTLFRRSSLVNSTA